MSSLLMSTEYKKDNHNIREEDNKVAGILNEEAAMS